MHVWKTLSTQDVLTGVTSAIKAKPTFPQLLIQHLDSTLCFHSVFVGTFTAFSASLETHISIDCVASLNNTEVYRERFFELNGTIGSLSAGSFELNGSNLSSFVQTPIFTMTHDTVSWAPSNDSIERCAGAERRFSADKIWIEYVHSTMEEMNIGNFLKVVSTVDYI